MKNALTLSTLALTLALTGCGASVGAYAPTLAAQQAVSGGGANAKAVASKADTEWAEGLGKLTVTSATSTPGAGKTDILKATGTTAQGPLALEATVEKEGEWNVARPTRITLNGQPLTRGRATALGQVLLKADATAVGGEKSVPLMALDSALLYNRISSGAFDGFTVTFATRTTSNAPDGHWIEHFTLTGQTAKTPFRLVIDASNRFPGGGTSYVSMAFKATFNGRAVKGDQAAELGELLGEAADSLGQNQQFVASQAAQSLWFNQLGK